jgi:pimeloyl-ACP methyl ester carboxylesterase
MALADPRRGPVVYLARPCQYVLPASGRNCSQVYWTGQRYAPAIVDSLGEALDQEKQRAGASTLLLIGYSGGGALAALLAQRRPDVAGIVTVAANLDLAYWTRRDRLGTLEGSLDPADQARLLRGLPQLHLAGADDRVVGPDVTRAFLQRMDGGSETLRVQPGFDHVCCWAAQWPSLLQRADVQGVLAARARPSRP